MTKPPLDVTVVATGNRPRTLLRPPQQPCGSGRCPYPRSHSDEVDGLSGWQVVAMLRRCRRDMVGAFKRAR